MLDGFDYKEPACSLCGGKDFYSPDKDAPSGRIPVMRIIEKLDGFLNRNDTESARAHLVYWKKEAYRLLQKSGRKRRRARRMRPRGRAYRGARLKRHGFRGDDNA